MAVNLGVVTGRAIERSGTTLLARIVGYDGAAIVQSTLSALSYRVRDIDGQTSAAEVTGVSIATCVYNALQTGAIWTEDSTGYNFALTIPATALAWTPELDGNGNPKSRRFQVDVKFTPVTGEPFVVPFSLWVAPAWIGGA